MGKRRFIILAYSFHTVKNFHNKKLIEIKAEPGFELKKYKSEPGPVHLSNYTEYTQSNYTLQFYRYILREGL